MQHRYANSDSIRGRICMLVTSDLTRDARVQKEAESATEAGYDVKVICRKYAGPPTEYDVKSLEVLKRHSRLTKILERFWLNIRFIVESIKFRPVIIHANDLDTLPAGYIAARLCRAKLVYDAHEFWIDAGRDIGSVTKAVAKSVERRLIRKADAVVTVSPSRAALLGETYQIPRPMVVMNAPRYVDMSGATLANATLSTLRPSNRSRVVFYLGVYAPERGLEEALLSTKYLRADTLLVFQGYGALEPTLKQLAKENNLTNRVLFLPPVLPKQVVQSAVGADIGLVLYKPKNLNNKYAAPNKLYDYLMAGVPIAGSNLPSISEFVEKYKIGRVFDVSHPQDIARVLNEMLEDSAEIHAMKSRALTLAKRFNWETESKTLLQIYQQLLRR